MSVNINKFIREYKEQESQFKNEILGNKVEKDFLLSANQKLYLGIGTPHLEKIIRFDTFLDRGMLNESVLNLIKRHGLLRCLLMNDRGVLKWKQYETPSQVHVPFIDLSAYELKTQTEIMAKLALKKSWKKFSSRSQVYRMIAVKTAFLLYLKRKLGEHSLLVKLIDKTWNITKYLKRNYRKDGLLYKMVLVKKNLREYFLMIRIDHIIGDETTLKILKDDILRCYQSKGKMTMEDPLPYDHYVKQIGKGPQDINEKELTSRLGLDDYKRQWQVVRKFISKRFVKKVHTFRYEYQLNGNGNKNIKEEEVWTISLILVNILCHEILGLKRIPAKILHYGRKYYGYNYFNTVGEFWDVMPVVFDLDEKNLMKIAAHANGLLPYVASHNVNFVSLFLNESLHDQWGNVADLFIPKQITPPDPMVLINFLGKIESGEINLFNEVSDRVSKKERKSLHKDHYLRILGEGSFSFRTFYNSEAIVINLDALIPLDIQRLTKVFPEKADRIFQSKITGKKKDNSI